MHVLIVPDFRRRVIGISLLCVLWLSMIVLSDSMSTSTKFTNVSLSDNIKFSYPINMKIDRVYVSEKADVDGVKTTGLFSTAPVNVMKNIEAKGLGFSFSFPSAFQISEQSFVGNEILYHVDYSDKGKNIAGFVQVWNLQTPLKDFLINSKNTSPGNFKNFEMSELKINNLDGYLWDYTAVNDNNSIKALEAFFQKDGKMYRVSYFVPEKSYTKEHEKIFMNILKSLKIS